MPADGGVPETFLRPFRIGVVQMLCGQLGHRDAPEAGSDPILDLALRLVEGLGRPTAGSELDPLVEQLSERTAIRCRGDTFGDERCQRLAGLRLGAP